MDSGQGPVWSGVETRKVKKVQISSNPYRRLRCFLYNNSLACWSTSKNLTYGIPPPLPTTKGQQNLNRSLVVGAGNYYITGCARGTWVVEISSLALKKVGTTDATWIGPDWIKLPLWFTKQQNLGIGLQGLNRPSPIHVVSSSFTPHPHLFTAVHPSPVEYRPRTSDLCDYLTWKLLLSSQPSLSGNVNQEQLHEVWFTTKY